ncbi:hypothetical protein Sango_1723600 [Sesamum angolense]|uniref:Aminotransferase-like plant mobile domain-containing protein n=1 Tax=Sesamum angolense TaxID=2727404 RepID=A0AAE1WLB1_9LAMI|nr:hypothetical protein Sango_1723600 [Sesamum angolense]
MSIPLWDLRELAGLPMTDCLYDEVVPSALELTGIDEKSERFIPRSSKYLFYAYHLLQSADDNRCSHVSIDKWVKFWSKKTTKYHPPPSSKEKKTVRPKSTHNPLGYIAIYERWSTAEEALFANLFIERSLKEEVYLAAYLACWLCVFVLPELRGPKVTRFFGEGGAKYYEPREARKRIHKVEFVSWACNMLVRDGSFKFVDDGQAEELDHSYFIAIRSSYLTLRQGDRFIIQPYNPHRFDRQFGYYQDVPGTLRYDPRVASLEEGLRYWRLCVLSKSSSKAWFPYLPANAKKLCSEAYKAWWAKVHGTFFDDNITCLIKPKSIKIKLKCKKDEDKQVVGGENDPPHALIPPIAFELPLRRQLEDQIQSIDVGEESETSHSSTMTPPLGMGFRRKQSPPPVAVSVFKGGGIVEHILAKVRAYDEARSLSSEKLSRSLHEQQLKEAKACLQDVQAKASEEASEIQSAMDELEHIEEDIVVLKDEERLRATLKEKKQFNHDTQAKVHAIEKDIATLESTGPLDDAIVENLESSRANLGILKEDLKSLTFFLEICLRFCLLLILFFFFLHTFVLLPYFEYDCVIEFFLAFEHTFVFLTSTSSNEK